MSAFWKKNEIEKFIIPRRNSKTGDTLSIDGEDSGNKKIEDVQEMKKSLGRGHWRDALEGAVEWNSHWRGKDSLEGLESLEGEGSL